MKYLHMILSHFRLEKESVPETEISFTNDQWLYEWCETVPVSESIVTALLLVVI